MYCAELNKALDADLICLKAADVFGIKLHLWQWFLVGMALCFVFFFIFRWIMRL